MVVRDYTIRCPTTFVELLSGPIFWFGFGTIDSLVVPLKIGACRNIIHKFIFEVNVKGKTDHSLTLHFINEIFTGLG
jgi:hypothetical protein